MHALLPSLGADLFQALMGEVQGALSRVGAPSRAVEDYVDKIQFLGQVRGRARGEGLGRPAGRWRTTWTRSSSWGRCEGEKMGGGIGKARQRRGAGEMGG